MLTQENQITWRKSHSSANMSTTTPTCTEGLNLFSYTVESVSNCLNSGLAISVVYTNYSLHTLTYQQSC